MISPKLILSSSLKHVLRHGWSKDALAAGAIELGLPPVAHGIVENGGAALVEEHRRRANEQFAKEMEEFIKTPGLKSNKDIVEFGLWTRLQKTIPVQPTWAQAMALGAKPENIATTAQQLSEIADIIASRLDNKEDSYEWYVNRAALVTAYCTCELFMLSDYSEDFSNTKRFIRSRVVEDGSRILQTVLGFGDVASTLVSGLTSASDVGFKMGLDALKTLVPGAATSLGPMNIVLAALSKQNPRTDQSRSSTNDPDDIDESLVEVTLPEGLSLFGLVSKDVKEASDLLKQNNPALTIITWPMWESIPQKSAHVDPRKVVRLVHDKQNIVIDVLRM